MHTRHMCTHACTRIHPRAHTCARTPRHTHKTRTHAHARTTQARITSGSNLDSRFGKYSRVFNDALLVVGKPNGLRATEWIFDEFCGQTSANGIVAICIYEELVSMVRLRSCR